MLMETIGQTLAIIRSIWGWLFLSFWVFQFEFSPISVSTFIAYAPIIYVSDSFYLFGGIQFKDESYSDEKTIGRLDIQTREWSNVGSLVTGRNAHNAIYDGQYVLVIGGHGTKRTEKCSISNERVTCSSQTPKLINYAVYPEVFLVPENFCP